MLKQALLWPALYDGSHKVILALLPACGEGRGPGEVLQLRRKNVKGSWSHERWDQMFHSNISFRFKKAVTCFLHQVGQDNRIIGCKVNKGSKQWKRHWLTVWSCVCTWQENASWETELHLAHGQRYLLRNPWDRRHAGMDPLTDRLTGDWWLEWRSSQLRYNICCVSNTEKSDFSHSNKLN